jgi:hypothetical protein
VSFSLEQLPEVAGSAWARLRDELHAILGDDLVAIWAYGGTIGSDRPNRPGDLDTHVIVRRRPDEHAVARIKRALDATVDEGTFEWDTWFIVLGDARRPESPPHAFLAGRRDTAWALHRSHWLAGRYVNVHGPEPAEIVLAPTWSEVELDLDRELEHVERHIREGDTDPYEASYAILNGSRILHTIETRDAVLSKRGAGAWALTHLPDRWHASIGAALRAYDARATAGDAALLASEMAPFVAMVRERLPATERQHDADGPRWSGY